MCLAVPGKIISFKKNIAQVDFNGTKREVSIDLVPKVKKNNYVLVHAGFAISVLNDKEAMETLNIFRKIYDMEKKERGRKQEVKRPQKNINQKMLRRR